MLAQGLVSIVCQEDVTVCDQLSRPLASLLIRTLTQPILDIICRALCVTVTFSLSEWGGGPIATGVGGAAAGGVYAAAAGSSGKVIVHRSCPIYLSSRKMSSSLFVTLYQVQRKLQTTALFVA